MHAFDYETPATLAEAIAQMARHDGRARPLAGGTDLIDQMRIGRHSPELLIDVKKIAELSVLAVDAEGLHVGAAVPCYRIYGNATVVARFTALAESCRIIGGIQIQSRASVGGNLCNSGPAADTTPSMIVLRGVCVVAGPGGAREVPVESFCTGPGENVLQSGELLVEIRFPPRAERSGSHYRRMIPRNEMDIAVVGVGASVELDETGQGFVSARIALGAVAPTPLLAEAASAALVGQPVNDRTIATAADAARAIVAPITDMRGTREYRMHATGVLVNRVVQAAVARARGETVAYRPGH
jgi:carbon-monoxide dehydrogenase medium subunit